MLGSVFAGLASTAVAPLPGRVDRNRDTGGHIHTQRLKSLPSRGAWIEISTSPGPTRAPCVAPLTGSVDRNQFRDKVEEYMALSLPSRGAWIEILLGFAGTVSQVGRSPHGERG